ncbi:MAG: DUF192 domain-containing protein [Gemmatimonadales bacterium]|nr:MAG: DUF192 domain-containing protein [Gemmatimonadales bacterium]
MPNHRLFLVPLLLLLVPLFACQGDGDPGFGDPEAGEAPTLPPRGMAWVIFDGDTVLAEVAATPEAREQGLMFRTEIPDGTGMIFVFDEMGPRQFWMRNTFVALDIAFLDTDHRIVDIQQMEPETDELTESAAPAMFALEVRAGWFEEMGIGEGDRARIVFGRR